MPQDIAKQHSAHLVHHVKQGAIWLSASEQGRNTAALSYAALEFRFAIERLAIHYWSELLGRTFGDREIKLLQSFKSVEQQIYELGGHQRDIDGHFEFMRVMLRHMKIEQNFATPNIGQLSKYWHGCSELCHIAWVLGSALPRLQDEGFQLLDGARQVLENQLQGAISWPSIRHEPLLHLRQRFVNGEAKERDVLEFLMQSGAWASVEHPDGRKEFIGEAIPPHEPTAEV